MDPVPSLGLSGFGLSLPVLVRHTHMHTVPFHPLTGYYEITSLVFSWGALFHTETPSVPDTHFNSNAVCGSLFLCTIQIHYFGNKSSMGMFKTVQDRSHHPPVYAPFLTFKFLPLKTASSPGVEDSNRKRAFPSLFLAFPYF